VIGIAGSVAVGKSTTSRILQALLSRWPDHPEVALVTTDGFLPQRRTRAPRADGPQGLPGVLRHPRAGALRRRGEGRRRRGARAGLLAPHLRHRPRREDRGPPAGRADRRGAQRPADRAPPTTGACSSPTSSTSRSTSTPTRPTSALVRRALPPCATPRSRTRGPTSTGTPTSTTPRPTRSRRHLAADQRPQPASERPADPLPGDLILRKGPDHAVERVLLRKL
jgi:hypothetical protein